VRVVIDTNAFVSAVLFDGPTSGLLTLWQRRKMLVVLSPDILDEYLRVLTYPKFKLTKREIGSVLNRELLPYAVQIKPKARINAAVDPDDNKFIEAAVSGKAKFLISGDRDLLEVERVRNVQIISPSEFLKTHAEYITGSRTKPIRKR
jgi:putative PIN family toxin of toxin-antitoxin system